MGPIAYLEKIKPEAEKYGLAHIVPPPGWDPPFALERGTNGVSMESFRFQVRKQYTSHLCRRPAPAPPAPGTPGGSPRAPPATGGRYSGSRGGGGGSGSASPRAADGEGRPQQQAAQQQQQQQQAQGQPQGEGKEEGGSPAPATGMGEQLRHPPAEQPRPQQAPAGRMAGAAQGPTEFGFPHLERRHTLRSFSAYADWVKEVHFSDPLPAQDGSRGAGVAARGARCSQRRPRSLPNYSTLPGGLR
jgi:histone demethylase JARID1